MLILSVYILILITSCGTLPNSNHTYYVSKFANGAKTTKQIKQLSFIHKKRLLFKSIQNIFFLIEIKK